MLEIMDGIDGMVISQFNSVEDLVIAQFNSVEDDIYALEKAHKRTSVCLR